MLRRWIMDPKIHVLLQSGAYLLAGFFFSGASLAGWCQPIALGALCALSGWPALLLAAGVWAVIWSFGVLQELREWCG
jgi:hypothetical protein